MINNSLHVWFYRLVFLLIFVGACAHGVSVAEASRNVQTLGAAVPQAMVGYTAV